MRLILSLLVFFTANFLLTSCSEEEAVIPQVEVEEEVIDLSGMPWHQASITPLEKALYDVAYKLKIPYNEHQKDSINNIYSSILRFEDKSTSNPRKVYLRFKLDRREVDFYYVNMLLKQAVESVDGHVVSGNKIVHWKNYSVGHELTYLSKDKSYEYLLRLVYDKAPYKHLTKEQKIAVVISELGENKEIVTENISLFKDNNITLSFCGDYDYSAELSALANDNDLETMLTIPLESYKHGYYESTKREIPVTYPVNEYLVERKLNNLRTNVKNAKGITHSFGQFASTEAEFMKVIIDYCKKNNLYYIDSMTASKSVAYKLAQRNQVSSTWALSYKKVSNSKVIDLLEISNTPLILLSAKNKLDIDNLKSILKLLKRQKCKLVSVSDLLKSDLPKIK